MEKIISFCNMVHSGDFVGFPNPRRVWNELHRWTGDLEEEITENCVDKESNNRS